MILFREILIDHEITHADNVEDAKVLFAGNEYDLILLDHDLEDAHYQNLDTEVGTGTEFARWMVEAQSPEQGSVVIHSYNPDGAKRMEDALLDAGWAAYRSPFGLTLLTKLQQLVHDVETDRKFTDTIPQVVVTDVDTTTGSA